MLEFFIEHIFEFILSAILTSILGILSAEIKSRKALKAATYGMLHDSFFRECERIVRKKYCTVNERENLDTMFKPYKMLGGNGSADSLYRKCQELPLEPEEKEDTE